MVNTIKRWDGSSWVAIYDKDIFLQKDGSVAMTGDLVLYRDPPATNVKFAVTKNYADNLILSHAWKDTVHLATTENISLSGLAQPIDGYTYTAGIRVLVKNQTLPIENGIYDTSSGAWIRSWDGDSPGDIYGACVTVAQGVTNSETMWVCTADLPVALGATPLQWAQFGGDGKYVRKTGDSMSGLLTSTHYEANYGTVKYMTAPLTWSHLSWYDAPDAGNGFTEARIGYVGKSNEDPSRMSVGSDTNRDLRLITSGTGRVLLSSDPTAALHAATKQYVDGKSTKINEYTTVGTATWTKPVGAVTIEVILIGGGGGGGCGRSDAASTIRPGGGGGGGGGYTHVTLPASMFAASETVTVAAAGQGATATTGIHDGVSGTAGGTSAITTNTSSIYATGGGAGDGASAAGALCVGGGRGTIMGLLGAGSDSAGGVGLNGVHFTTGTLSSTRVDQAVNHYTFTRGAPGGSSGGGMNAAGDMGDGGTGMTGWDSAAAAAGGNSAGTGVGGNGISYAAGQWLVGGGGGGGASFGSGSGGAGGVGGKYGAGGGGGSGKSSASGVGHGGDGAQGLAVIITHF